MKKQSNKTIALLALLFVPLFVWGQKNIPMVLENESIRQSGPRSPIPAPTATLDGAILTFSFVNATPSEVIIIDLSSGQAVYSYSFAASAQLSIDLSGVCSVDVSYLIRLNAFGEWWRGNFVIEENKPAPAANGTIVEQDSVFYQLKGNEAVIVYSLTAYNTLYHERLEHQINYPDTLVIPSEIIYEGVSYEVTGIEAEGLRYCNSTAIILPNTIQYIDYLAFCCCEKLEHMKLPESLAGLGPFGTGQFTMGSGVFAGCTSLKSVEFPEGFLKICDGFFEDCRNLTSVTLPNSLTFIGRQAFMLCTSLPSIVIPEGVSTIEPGAFYLCFALESIVIPESVSFLGEGAFNGCENLKTVSLPNSLSEFSRGCFCNCFALESIVIPEGVEVISVSLFSRCSSLSSVVLPKSLTEIESYAFYNIADSAHIYCQSIEPPTVKDAFNNYGGKTLHVPQGCKEKYEESPYWKDFTTVIDDIVAGSSSDSDETGIFGVLSDDAVSSERFFDLQGRPADGTKKGIYIRNGKKVLVR